MANFSKIIACKTYSERRAITRIRNSLAFRYGNAFTTLLRRPHIGAVRVIRGLYKRRRK